MTPTETPAVTPTPTLTEIPVPVTPAPGPAFVSRAIGDIATCPNAIATADLNGDGLFDLVTANACSSNVSVLLGQTDHSFLLAPGSPFRVGASPHAIAVRDLNGDGLPDLVTANPDTDNVSVLLGQNDHSFAPAPGSPFGVGASYPVAVVVTDLDHDGLMDIVTANENSGNVSVLLGQSDHAFTAAPGSPFNVEASPESVAVADLDGDGTLDIVTANAYSSSVSILLGQPRLRFRPSLGSPFSVGSSLYPRSVAVADLDGDGLADIVTANEYGTVSVLLGVRILSYRTFVPAAGSPFSNRTSDAEAIAVADFNGDGVFDLATANGYSNSVSVMLGVSFGRGSYTVVAAPKSPFAAGSSPYGLAVADFNGDGLADVATANRYSNDVTVLLGQNNYEFVPVSGSAFTVGPSGPAAVAVADLNGDGLPDLVLANQDSNNVSVLFNQPDHNFIPAAGSPIIVGSAPGALAIIDLNGDRLLDLVAANASSNDVSVLIQQPDHSLAPAANSSFNVGFGFRPISVAAADLNADGLPDLVTANADSNDVSVLLQQPDQSFAPAPGSPFSVRAFAPVSVAVADLNADGFADIVTANQGSSSVSVLLGQPNTTFVTAPSSPLQVGDGPAFVATVDLNGDGLLDLVTANSYSDDVSVLLQQVDHTFSPAPESPLSVGAGAGPRWLAFADINSDGMLDIVTANGGSDDVSVLLGQNDHSFRLATNSPFRVGASGMRALAVADLNGDGLPDVVTANEGGIVVLFQVAR